jgi:diguanylate cyclase (GGDEF)-like protein/PAS domain S-box-containing protein
MTYPPDSQVASTSLYPSATIPAALYLLHVDASGHRSFRFVTDRLLAMLDLTREQLLADAQVVFQRVHPEDYPGLMALQQQVLEAPQPFFWEGRVVVGERAQWWRLESLPRPLPEGGTLWEGVATDITATRNAEAAREASEIRFERLVRFAPVPLGSLDQSLKTRFYNEAFTKTFGYTAADLPDWERWWEAAYPDPSYRQWLRQSWDSAIAAWSAGDHSRLPFKATVTCKDGQQRFVEIHPTAIGDDHLAAFVDVTEHRLAQRRERELQGILRDIVNDEPLPMIAARILRAAQSMLPGRLGALLRVDREQQCLRLLAAPNLPHAYRAAMDGLAIRDGNGVSATAAARGERVTSTDLRIDPISTAKRAALPACIADPVLDKDGQVLAILALHAQQPWHPSGAEKARIDALTSLVGLAIEHAQARETLIQQTACEAAVRDISRLFLAENGDNLDAVVTTALGRIGACLDAHRCYLFLMASDGLTMTCTHEWCSPGTRPQIDDCQNLPVDRYPWLPEIARSRQAAFITQDDIAKLSCEDQRIIVEGDIQSMLAMPLFETEELCGILGPDNVHTQKRWSEFEQRLLRLVADIITTALERERLQRALHDQAYRDSLTGLPNRRAFDERLAAEIERGRRYGQVFSLLLFDIDHFKTINDTHGHAVGDQVLQHLARVTLTRLRLADALARWGGEEFALLLPETAAAGALRLAEQLREVIAATDFPAIGRLTVSIGVTEFLPEDNGDRLFRRVDRALYAAKEQGRNCCVFRYDKDACSEGDALSPGAA